MSAPTYTLTRSTPDESPGTGRASSADLHLALAERMGVKGVPLGDGRGPIAL